MSLEGTYRADQVSEIHNFLTAALCEAIRQLGGMLVFNPADAPSTGGILVEPDPATGMLVVRVTGSEETSALLERHDAGGGLN